MLTRSTSLPFSVTLLQPEKNSTVSSHHSDYVTLVRRGSSGQVNTATFTSGHINQQPSAQRPLVRQTAIDCNHAADTLFVNSSVEASVSCDLDTEKTCGEQSNGKLRRKKAQKFAYNKWYMYGGGTFKKLYSPEKSSENSLVKVRKYCGTAEHDGLKKLTTAQKEIGTGSGSVVNSPNISSSLCSLHSPAASLATISTLDRNQPTVSAMAPLRRNLSLSVLPSLSVGTPDHQNTDRVTRASKLVQEHSSLTSQLSALHIPPNRKKQRTDGELVCALGVDSNPITTSSPPSVPDRTPQHR